MKTIVKTLDFIKHILQSVIVICSLYTAITISLDYFYGFGLPSEPPLIIFWIVGFPFGLLIIGLSIAIPILLVGSFVIWILGID